MPERRQQVVFSIVSNTIGVLDAHQVEELAIDLQRSIPVATVERTREEIHVRFAARHLYDVDADELRPEAVADLGTLASRLRTHPHSTVFIVAAAQARSAVERNPGLSLRRAISASAQLAREGVSRGRQFTAGRVGPAQR